MNAFQPQPISDQLPVLSLTPEALHLTPEAPRSEGVGAGAALTLPPEFAASMSHTHWLVEQWGEQQAMEQARLHSEIEALRAQLDHMHAKLGLAYEDISSLQRERSEAQRGRDAATQEREQALSDLRAMGAREQATREQLAQVTAAHRQAEDAHQAEIESHRETQQAHREEAQAHQQTQQAHQQEVKAHQQTQQAHQQEVEAHRETQQAHRDEVEAHQQTQQEKEQARQEQQAEQALRRAEQQEREAERETERAQVEALADKNTQLRERLLELYSQLHARDLPSLILQVAINLTGSECGLFVEADGDGALAHEGLDELPEFIQEALYDWTRRVARDQEPVRENDASKLPDGAKLVNLAALPVSLHSELTGVILVANKRAKDGEPEGYTEDDTELLVAIGRHASLAMENRRLHTELGESFQSTVAVLADAIEAKDAYTRGHCDSVSDLAVTVASRLGFEGEALLQIRYAALLHDIGKIGVPDGILLKPGRLLPEEFSIIQRHSQIGRDLIARVPSLSHIAPIVMHHHERIDGTGYPNGLLGDSISLASRIICVADAFDAMTTPRPYREAVSAQEAVEELRRCSGTHFDPLVVNITAEVLAERV